MRQASVPGLPGRLPPGAVSPGEIISIFGSDLGPQPGTSVLFDGVAAPLLDVGMDRINAVVPFGVEPAYTKLTVERLGRLVASYELPVSDVVPAIFTANGGGFGRGGILNEDGTLNSA